MQITNHTQILNAIIEKYGLKSYLEIGVQNQANNFDRVKCDIKIGVDPDITPVTNTGYVCVEKTDKNEVGDYLNWYELRKETSDEYFSGRPRIRVDVVFIDGLHTAEQVKRDFENSLRCLSDNGFIVIHDVLPENEEGTRVPRETKQWWGDVYKWAMNIGTYPGIGYKTFNIDNGCMLVWKDINRVGGGPIYRTDYNNYLKAGKIAMNVTDEVEV